MQWVNRMVNFTVAASNPLCSLCNDNSRSGTGTQQLWANGLFLHQCHLHRPLEATEQPVGDDFPAKVAGSEGKKSP